MSVKCNYSAKFLPLLKKIQLETPNELESFIKEYFNDAEIVYERFIKGTNTGTFYKTFQPIKRDKTWQIVENDTSESTDIYYFGNVSAHEQLIRQFKSNIIESSLYNKNTDEFINANEVSEGYTVLNRNLFSYKVQLLNVISNYLYGTSTFTENDINTNVNDLTTAYRQVIDEFKLRSEQLTEKDPKFDEAYNAYVILTHFNSLLSKYAPFISILPEYRNTTDFYVDMYTFKGPHVEHYTGFSTNEHVDAEDQTSDLVKILLDYFPEVNINGQPIDNTSITLTGFLSSMTKVILAVQNEPLLSEYKSELQNGVNANMSMLIDKYLEYLNQGVIVNAKHKSYLQNKLRGIKHFIYDSNLSKEVKDTFTATASKTKPASYVSYEYDTTAKELSPKDLIERPISIESYTLSDLLKGAVYQFKSNERLFDEKINKYNVTIGNKNITFNTVINNVPNELVLQYDLDNTGKLKFSFYGNFSNDFVEELTYDFLSFIVPDDLDSVIKQVYPLEDLSQSDLLLPLVGLTILGSTNNPHIEFKNEFLDTTPHLSTIKKLASVLSVINGSDTINVIKNVEGNNLPLSQLISLVYNYDSIINKIDQTVDRNISWYNPLFLSYNDHFVLPPKIRSDVTINGKTKNSASLTTKEVFTLSILYDFYQNLQKDGIVNLQPTTFSDKNRHFLIPFDLNKDVTTIDGKINVKTILNNFLNDIGSLDTLIDTMRSYRKSSINQLVENICTDYNAVFNKNFKTLSSIDNYIQKNKLSENDIKNAFKQAGVNFYEEIHLYKTRLSKYPRTNETIKFYQKITADKESFSKYINVIRKKFFKDILTNNVKFNVNDDRSFKNVFKNFKTYISEDGNVTIGNVMLNGQPVESESINLENFVDNPNYQVTLHPIFESYFITDMFLSNAYNEMMIGGVWAHPNKNNSGKLDSDKYFEESVANRLVSQYKRMVIYGASYHPFAQGLKNGVAEEIKIAVIKDVPGSVWNMLGDKTDGLDSMDGSGFALPYQSRAENNSLLDASVGKDKKTIMHDIDPIYGRPTLLKWAVFEINNERRRLSTMSECSLENMFRKMTNIPFNKDLDLAKYYDEYDSQTGAIYFKNWKNSKVYMIDNIRSWVENGILYAERVIHELDSDYEIVNTSSEIFTINKIYDLDQLFGGAWAMTYNIDSNKLEYSEANIDVVENIINEENLKQNFIAYLVNKSAIKVGAGNVNDISLFNRTNDENLQTITMSTKFGGVQMNADHELDLAEVTEMTQMISALEQNGNSHNLVRKIYSDIGKVTAESLTNINQAIREQDREKIYMIYGKALVQSFMTGDRDTLGLAQSFVQLANKSLKESDLDYTLPFSAATINGAFVSTVTSNLVKKGIRRKYAGIASVLAPSFNMMQYYTLFVTNDKTLNYSFEEVVDIVNKDERIPNTIMDEYGNPLSRFEVAFNDIMINGQLNPYLKQISIDQIDFEDTIVIFRDSRTEPETVKINSWDQYDAYKHNLLTENDRIYLWTLKPKNLKQSDTKFQIPVSTLEDGTVVYKTFSIYELDIVRALHYIKNNKFTKYSDLEPWKQNIIARALKLSNLDTKLDAKTLEQHISTLTENVNSQLKQLGQGQPIPSSEVFKVPVPAVKPQNVKVIPAQIIMGKTNAKQLSLQKGDTIAKIQTHGVNFFYNRLINKYQRNNPDADSYDFITYDAEGREFYIKVLSSEDAPEYYDDSLRINGDFKVVDNDVYYNSKRIVDKNEKQFYKYQDSNGNAHDLIVVNNLDRLNELLNSAIGKNVRLNYTKNNKDFLLKYQFKDIAENNGRVKLKTYNSLGEVITTKLAHINDASLRTLQANENIRFENRLYSQAENMYQAFIKQLNYIGARIPTQSMQSFMGEEVVLYTDSEVNDVYVPRQQTWLQGSDRNHCLYL